MNQKIDVTNVSDWANLLIGLLDKGEWKTLLFTLVITFSMTYILKLVYFSVISKKNTHPNHIRLIAIVSGFIASALVWNEHAISMHWYTAGIMVGPLSIIVHHILIGVAGLKTIRSVVPFLYDIVKGGTR